LIWQNCLGEHLMSRKWYNYRRFHRRRPCARRRSCSEIGSALVVLILVLVLPACNSKTRSDAELSSPSADKLELLFTYGSEKEKWINDVTTEFNRAEHKPSSGKRIYVRAVAMGSGEAIDEVMEGRRQPPLISPASAAFIRLGNAQSQS